MDKKYDTYCYYCDDEAISEDHLPPNCIFNDPKPSNRIKVPSCSKHNLHQSKNDEYFRWFITTASAGNAIAEKIVKEKIKRQFQRKPKLLYHIFKQRKKIELYSKSGIYLGTKPAFEYDRDRIQSVISRLTKGLYFHFFKEKLPKGSVVEDFILNPQLDGRIKNAIIYLPLYEIGKDTFSFRFVRDEQNKCSSSWLFLFYNKTLIWSLTS